MRILNKIAFLIAISLVTSFANGQIAFRKLYSNNGYDYGQGIVQLPDSSYVICGSSSSFGEGPSQAFLLKIDSLGNYIWSNNYGGSESEWARRVLYKEGDGFFGCGYTNSSGNGGYDIFLFKTDLTGQLEWQKTIGGSNWEKVNDAILTPDNGVLMVGETNSTTNGDNDAYLVKTGNDGDTLWTKRIGGLGEDRAFAVELLNDSTFFVAGEIYVSDSSLVKGFISRMKFDGTIEWIDTIGINGNYGVRGIDLDVVSNRVSYVGWQQPVGTTLKNSLFGKVNYTSVFDFEQIEVPSSGEKIIELLTNYGSLGKNYMCFSYFDASSFNDGYDVGISKVGEGLYWDGLITSINYPLEDAPGEIIPTSDGSAIFVGYTSGLGAGGGNVYVMKIGPNDVFPPIEFDPVPFSLVNVNENTEISNVVLYPNPFNNSLVLNATSKDESSYSVKDMTGKDIASGSFIESFELNTTEWNSGFYLIQVTSNNQEVQYKALKL
jgi:hypothetical protein